MHLWYSLTCKQNCFISLHTMAVSVCPRTLPLQFFQIVLQNCNTPDRTALIQHFATISWLASLFIIFSIHADPTWGHNQLWWKIRICCTSILFDKSQCKLAHFLRWHVSYYTFYVVPASPAGSCCSIFLCDFSDGWLQWLPLLLKGSQSRLSHSVPVLD